MQPKKSAPYMDSLRDSAAARMVAPAERPAKIPQEQTVMAPQEASDPGPAEAPVCGINGCRTWYDDPIVMERHRRRQHGIGEKNDYPPAPRSGKPCEGISL